MARTKRGTRIIAQSKPDFYKFRKIEVRMPDGERVETDGMRFQEFWLVKVPYTCGKPEKDFGFNNGLRKGEFGLYIRQIEMWYFRRSESDPRTLQMVFKQHLYWSFDDRRKKFRACLEKMKNSGSRKRAKEVLEFYIKKYGYWSYGWFFMTRTQGYNQLLKRKEDFQNLVHKCRCITDLSPRPVFCENPDFWIRR